MSKISLNATYTVVQVPQKTSAKFWKDVQIGDEIYFSVTIKREVIRGQQGCYPPVIEMQNLRTGEIHHDSWNALYRNLQKFDFENKDSLDV